MQVTDLDGAVVMLLVLGVRRGQHHVLQPQTGSGRVPPGGQHRVRGHRERHVPGQQRQVPEQGDRISPSPAAGISVISSTARSAAAIVIARRALPLTFPRGVTCAATWPIVPDCPVISSSCCSMIPAGVISRVPAGLHPPVATHHRGRDRDRLAEHHHVPGADLPLAGRRQRGPVPLPQQTAQRRPQVSSPHRDDPRTCQARRPPARDGNGTSGRQHGTVQRHQGLRGRERLQQPLLLPGAPPGSTQPGHNTPPCRITNPSPEPQSNHTT